MSEESQPSVRWRMRIFILSLHSDPFQESPYLFHLWHANWISVSMQTYLQGWLLPTAPPPPTSPFFPLSLLLLIRFSPPLHSSSSFSSQFYFFTNSSFALWPLLLLVHLTKDPRCSWLIKASFLLIMSLCLNFGRSKVNNVCICSHWCSDWTLKINCVTKVIILWLN